MLLLLHRGVLLSLSPPALSTPPTVVVGMCLPRSRFGSLIPIRHPMPRCCGAPVDVVIGNPRPALSPPCVCVYRFPFSRIAQWQRSGGVIIIYIYLRMTTMYTPACANVDKKDPRSLESIGKVGALLLVVVGGKVGRWGVCSMPG